MDYIPFSHPPFEGDKLIGLEIQKLCKEHGVQTIIETGTQSGATARELVRLTGARVYTIENDFNWYRSVSMQIASNHVHPLYGYSEDWLTTEFPNPVLLYLDAHDMSGSPIRKELQIVSQWLSKPIVVVHDVKVPGKDFGCDIYKDGTELTYEYFKDAIGWKHDYHYNEEAEGARRGVIYIIPCLQ